MACFPETLEKVLKSQLDTLKFRCRACGHIGQMQREIAIAVFGEHATPTMIGRRRFRCSRCRSANSPHVWI